MMFINNVSATQNVWQQLKWKVVVHQEKMLALLFIQVIFVLFLSGTSGHNLAGIGAINGDFITASLDVYAIAAMIYLFLVALFVGSSSTLRENFTIPTTRTLTNVSNSLYLLFVSLVTTILSYCSLYIYVAYQLLFHKQDVVFDLSEMFSIGHFISFILFMWMVSAASYLLASLFTIRNWLGILVIVFVMIVFRTEFQIVEQAVLLMIEGGVILFGLKCLIVAVCFYAIAFVMTAKLEVK